jgi:hypothetical protein
VDVRGDGGMVVAPPTRRADGQYRWLNDLPIAGAPPWLIDRVKKQPRPRHNGAGVEWTEVPATKLAAAVAAIPNDDLGWEEWNRVGMALWAATNGSDEGLVLFDRWSQKSGKYDAADTAVKWDAYDSCPPNELTAGTLFYLADQADPSWRARYTDQRPPPNNSNYELVRVTDVVMRAKNWGWRGHLLRGALELTTGMKGLGKSQVHCSEIACFTTTRAWPDGTASGPAMNVIMVTAEDTLDQDIKPRLIAAGADINRIFVLKKIKRDNKRRMFLLGEDLDILEQIIRDVDDVALVTLDPITAYMGKVDSHRATDVRGQLGPLADMAERTQVCFSAITHPPKAGSQKAIDLYIGSQAYIAAARIGHMCIEEMNGGDPTGRNLFTNVANNAAAKMPTLAYRVQTLTVGQDPQTGESIVSPYLVWESDPVAITADQAVAAVQQGGRPGRRNEAKAFLARVLAQGPVDVQAIWREGAAHGLSRDQLRRAREDMGIVVRHSSDPTGGWLWELPPHSI